MEEFKPVNKKLRVAHYPKPTDTPFRIDVPNEVFAKAVIDMFIQHMEYLYNQDVLNGYMDHFEVEMYDEENDEWDVYFNDHHGIEFDDIFEEGFYDLGVPNIDLSYMFLYPHITLTNNPPKTDK